MILSREERYVDLDNNEIREKIDSIFDRWKDFLDTNSTLILEINKDYFVNERNLFEIIKRTDKRKVYYHVFHKMNYDSVCEYKEIAILAYWINTLKPFMIVNPKSNLYTCANEMFSFFLILSVLEKVYQDQYNRSLPKLNDAKIADYIYNFKYCDFSREAMIQFVDMLASYYKIGTDIVIPAQSN